MVRKLSSRWNLRQLMAAHNIWKTTDLIPLLAQRGVQLSTAQVYRLVTDRPERLSMKLSPRCATSCPAGPLSSSSPTWKPPAADPLWETATSSMSG
jgi:hypothetical protein